MAANASSGLRARFPVLERLEFRRQKQVPLVAQNHASDCGPACLTMVMRHFGRNVGLADIRDEMGGGRDGVSAADLLGIARRHALSGRAVRAELDDLDYLPQGTILHWKMGHFVVLDRVRKGGIDIVDPALGRRFVPTAELDGFFTGVALLLEPTPTFERTAKGKSPALAYVRDLLQHSGLIGQILVTSIVLQIFAVALPLLTGVVVDRVVLRGDTGLLTVLAVGIGMVTLFSLVTQLLRAHLLLHLETNLDIRLTMGFLDHLMRLPFSFFQLRNTGDLMMRLSSNTLIRETITSSTIAAVLDGTLVTVYVVVLLLTHWGLGLLVLGLGALRVGIFLASRRRIRELMTESLRAQAEVSNYQIQMLEGIETVKSAGAEARTVQHWSNLFVDVMNLSLARGRLNARVQSALNALTVASPLVLLGYGGHLVVEQQLTLGTMLALNALAVGFLVPLTSLVQTALKFHTLGSYVDRVDDVLSKQPERNVERGRSAPDLLGDLELQNVSFRYADLSPWAVDDVSFAVERGTRVAIVGRSGSGKSSLARLLVALYPATSGQIRFDGMVLRDCDPDSIRRQIGFVPQFPYLFATTIRENIALTVPDAPLETIEQAAVLAGIHDEIMDMPLRYQTPMTAGGSSLSGGQRQRIALARALLNRPPILVLDEATSNLDAVVERRIHENLAGLRCTQIIIAHRLSTVVDADLILAMENGRIVERGTHAQLLQRPGLYASLFEAQLRRSGDPRSDA